MRSSLAVAAVAAIVGFCAGSAAADAPKLVKVSGGLPSGVKPSGDLQEAWSFGDKNGLNYVLFSFRQSYDRDPSREARPPQSQYLWVDHWVVPPSDAARLVRTVRDMVEHCEFDATAEFRPGALGVTDLDGDGYGEVTFAYETGCRSDVSANTYKLLLLENGDKYILRGHTRFATHDPAHPIDGGDFDPDPKRGKWPAAFLAHAKDVWAATSADSEMPPLGPDDRDSNGADPGPRDPNEHRGGGNPCGG